MPSAEYSAVPTETVVVVSNEQQSAPDLTDRIKASSRVVAVFCVIQLVSYFPVTFSCFEVQACRKWLVIDDYYASAFPESPSP